MDLAASFIIIDLRLQTHRHAAEPRRARVGTSAASLPGWNNQANSFALWDRMSALRRLESLTGELNCSPVSEQFREQ